MDVQEELSLEGFSSCPSSGRSLILAVMWFSRLQAGQQRSCCQLRTELLQILAEPLLCFHSFPAQCEPMPGCSGRSCLPGARVTLPVVSSHRSSCRKLAAGLQRSKLSFLCPRQVGRTAEHRRRWYRAGSLLSVAVARGHVHPDGSIPLARVGAGMQHRGMTYWEGNVPLLWWLDWVQLGLKCVLKYFLIRVSLWEVADGRAGLN